MPNAVTDNTALSRYELATDAGTAFVRYRLEGGSRNLVHAEVPVALRGKGAGSALAKGTLDLARSQGYRIIPGCPFIADYIRKHPEYRDLVG